MAYDLIRGLLEAGTNRARDVQTQRAGQKDIDRKKAEQILKAVLEGKIEKVPEGEGGIQESIYGPPKMAPSRGIGQRIKEGFGIGTPETTPGQAYRRVPEVSKYGPEALEFERAKAGITSGVAQEKERRAGEKQTLKDVFGIKKEAAEEGLSLQTAGGETPQEQLRAALQLYAARPEEEEKEKIPTQWEIEKEARIRVNAMMTQNPQLQMQAFENPGIVTNLIDKEVERLEAQYGESRPQASEAQLKAGSVYENAQGQQKKYLGNGRWGNP